MPERNDQQERPNRGRADQRQKSRRDLLQMSRKLHQNTIEAMIHLHAIQMLQSKVFALCAELNQLCADVLRVKAENALLKSKINSARQAARRIVIVMADRCAAAGRNSDHNDLMDVLNTPDESMPVHMMINAIIKCLKR